METRLHCNRNASTAQQCVAHLSNSSLCPFFTVNAIMLSLLLTLILDCISVLFNESLYCAFLLLQWVWTSSRSSQCITLQLEDLRLKIHTALRRLPAGHSLHWNHQQHIRLQLKVETSRLLRKKAVVVLVWITLFMFH